MGFEMRPSWWCQNILWVTGQNLLFLPNPPRELIVLYVIDRKSHRCLNLDFSVSFSALRQFIRPQAEDFRWFIFARFSFNAKCGSDLPVRATPECVTGWSPRVSLGDNLTIMPATYGHRIFLKLWKPEQRCRPRSSDEISINFSAKRLPLINLESVAARWQCVDVQSICI